MNEQVTIIKDYLENKQIDCDVNEEFASFWHELEGRISICRMELRPLDGFLQIAAQLPFHVNAEEYGRVLYALMNINRTLVRGGFELTPEKNLLQFRVCIAVRENECTIDAERMEKAIEYCSGVIRRLELPLMEILSSDKPFLERDGAEAFREVDDEQEYYGDYFEEYDDEMDENPTLGSMVKKLFSLIWG